MKQHGYFLIKIKKTINLYLWSENEEDLKESLKPGMQIVPCFKDDEDKEYIKVDEKMIRIG